MMAEPAFFCARVAAAFRPAERRLRVVAALRAAARRQRFTAPGEQRPWRAASVMYQMDSYAEVR